MRPAAGTGRADVGGRDLAVNAAIAAEDPTLETHGFARYSSDEVCSNLSMADVRALREPLTRYYADLPLDPNDPQANRYRRYASGVLVPWTQALIWMPGSPDLEFGTAFDFYQGDHNPEYPGTHRRFPYVDAEILDDPLLRHLVLFDVGKVLWLDAFTGGPIHVGVHFVKLSVAGWGAEAVSSPNCLHQDGGKFSMYFVHLLARDNAVGGENVIASPCCAGRRLEETPLDLIWARFSLEKPLDSYAVYDRRVSHYVSPVRRGDQPRPGARSAILIGLTPFVQQM